MNMPDRISLGLWPHPPIHFNECVNLIVTYLDENERFPRTWEAAEQGKVVHEGGTIQKISPQQFLYRSQASHPLDPTILRATTEAEFESPESAAIHYLKCDLRLPGDLDGWKVVE
jgi:hypothetical protein